MKPVKFILPLLLCAIFFGFTASVKKDNWKTLFNGKDFTGWDSYLAPDMDDTGKPITNQPIGLNNDPNHVFTVVDQDGEKVIRISGQNWGAISTKNAYENYHFQLQFKWGDLKWGQKKGKKKDSGLLYNSVGPFGFEYGSWMRSLEFQIEEGNCGDLWCVGGALSDVPVTAKSDSEFVYNPQGKLTKFVNGGKEGRHCIKQGDAENPSGQWNTLDLYCHGDTSIHVVNGKVMMVLYHDREPNNGGELPLHKGKIQLQSEGAEVFYKNIKIQPIERLPAELLKQ